MEKLLPVAMKARRKNAEEDAAKIGGRTAGDDEEEGNLPMFVMDVMLPGQSVQLNIFEPRYRLLVRRCMEGSRRFGMVGYDREQGRMNEWATEVEIVECQPIPDGRYHIRIVGRRGCQVLESRDQDGYVLSRVRYFRDEPDEEAPAPEPAHNMNQNRNQGGDTDGGADAGADAAMTEVGEGTGGEGQGVGVGGGGRTDMFSPPPSVQQVAREAEELVGNVITAFTAMGPRLKHFEIQVFHKIQSKMETKPPASDVDALSWWLVDCINAFVQVCSEDKLYFLELRSARVRMMHAMELISRHTCYLLEIVETRERREREAEMHSREVREAAGAVEVDEDVVRFFGVRRDSRQIEDEMLRRRRMMERMVRREMEREAAGADEVDEDDGNGNDVNVNVNGDGGEDALQSHALDQ